MSVLAVVREVSIPKLRYFACLCVLVIGAGSLVPVANADNGVYQKVLASTAWVVTDRASGTAVLVDRSRGVFATNFHVIEDAKSIHVYLPRFVEGAVVSEPAFYQRQNHLKIQAEIYRSDARRDLALLKIRAPLPQGIRQIEMADQSARPGQRVHSIGNSGNGGLWVYSSGSVRQVSILERNDDRPFKAKCVFTQSPINPGDSGGPIVNDHGELVGITTAYYRKARLISYGVDVSEVQSLLDGQSVLIDQRVVHALQKTAARYEKLSAGTLVVSEKFADGKQDVFIESATYRGGDTEYRLIYSVVTPYQSSEAVLKSVGKLVDAKVSPIGSWRIIGKEDRKLVVYLAPILANTDGKALRAMSRMVAACAVLGSRHLKAAQQAENAKLAKTKPCSS